MNTHGSSFTGSYTLFSFTDRIQINNSFSSTTFGFNIYLGHNNSFSSWGGDAKYTFILTEM
jgi:hypothetical protein